MSVLFAVEEQFDGASSFIGFVESTGRALQNHWQAKILIGLCGLFSRLARQQQLQHTELRK